MNDEELLAELNDVTQSDVIPQVPMALAVERMHQCVTCDYNVRLQCGKTTAFVHCSVLCKYEHTACPVGRW